jgi:hypothetical protein
MAVVPEKKEKGKRSEDNDQMTAILAAMTSAEDGVTWSRLAKTQERLSEQFSYGDRKHFEIELRKLHALTKKARTELDLWDRVWESLNM